MDKVYHKNLTGNDNHVLYAWSFSNAIDRTTATGIAAADIGKVAFQEDDSSFWILKNNTNLEWDPINNSMINNTLVSGIELQTYSETVATTHSMSGSLTLDLNYGNIFEVELVEDVSLEIINPVVSGTSSSLTLLLKQDFVGNRVVSSWPTSIKWPMGISPSLSEDSNSIDIFVFTTVDGGAVWYGMAAGYNFL
jgi:hypothetical protein